MPEARWPNAAARKVRRSPVQTSSSSAGILAESVSARLRPALIRRRASSLPRRWGMVTTSGSDIAAVSLDADRACGDDAQAGKGLGLRFPAEDRLRGGTDARRWTHDRRLHLACTLVA